MGEYVKKDNGSVNSFDTITNKAFRKLLSLSAVLKAYTYKFAGRSVSSYIFYDTRENLLQRAGILFYKTSEKGKHYYKIEKLSFLPKTFKAMDEQVFVHQISSQKDTPSDHSLYLIDAITSMFATQFNIDLENILKMVVPKMIVEIRSDNYKIFSGTGFKCDMALENVIYRNLETKKKAKRKEVTFTLDSPISFIKDYETFIQTITKYCKDITELTESRYEHAKNLTKISATSKDKSKKFKKEQAQKEKKAENIIEG